MLFPNPTESEVLATKAADLEHQLAALRAQADAAQTKEDRAKVQKAIDTFNEAQAAIQRQIARDAAAAEKERKAAVAKVNGRLEAIAAQVTKNNAAVDKACDRFGEVEKIAHEIGSTVDGLFEENDQLKREAEALTRQAAQLGATPVPVGTARSANTYHMASRIRMAAALKREAIALGAASILPDVTAALPHARN